MPQIDTAFTTQFQAEIYAALQNPGGVLESLGKLHTFTAADRMRFPKIGVAGEPGAKLPNGDIPTFDLTRSYVEVIPYDRYHGVWLDEIGSLKTNTDQRGAIVNAIVKAMARKNDQDALAALMLTSNAANSVGAADSFSSDAVPRSILETFGKNEAMELGPRHALVTWKAWADLLALTSFVNSQVGGDTRLTSEGVLPKMFYGFAYQPLSTLVTVTGETFKANLFFARDALAIGILMNSTSEIGWHQQKNSWLISAKGARNAVLMDSLPVIKRGYAA